jgi:DNA-directed RNA polymerase sigma subunit (sigma70/sigma32)
VGNERAVFREAIDDLEHALERSIGMARQMQARIHELRAADADGRELRDIVSCEDPPLIVQLLTESAQLLDSYGSRLRRAEARALHREGMTMDEIAHLFGVTRQRISALLREGAGPHAAGEPRPEPRSAGTG